MFLHTFTYLGLLPVFYVCVCLTNTVPLLALFSKTGRKALFVALVSVHRSSLARQFSSLHLSLSLACLSIYSECDFLLLEVHLILFANFGITESHDFLALDALNLVAIVIEFGSQLAALFHIVKLILMTHIRILGDLALNFNAVSNKSSFLSCFLLSFNLFIVLLLLYDAEEVVAFGFSFNGEAILFVAELLNASHFKVFLNFLSLNAFAFSASSSNFVGFFSGSLCFCVINFCLTVVSLFIKSKESL